MMSGDYLTNPYGDRDKFDIVEREAFDWLMKHNGEDGPNVVRALADLLRRPRCPHCHATNVCYGCASGGGPGGDLLPDAGEPNA